MIQIERVRTYGWEMAIEGMRNPLESWLKSDSDFDNFDCSSYIGDNDLALMKKLTLAGQPHRKFLRMLHVQMTVTAPQFWWMEFDAYKVGTTKNSCSKMHKIHVHEFSHDMFSHEAIDISGELVKRCFTTVILTLNYLREKFNETQDKKYWRAMIELLPTGFNMKATIDLDYETILNIVCYRQHHKITEWHYFCDVAKALPHFKYMCEGVYNGKEIIE